MDPRLPIRSIDYSVIFARQMPAMREFYGHTLAGPTDQPFGHRTLFVRDPDGNVLEIYAEIEPAP
jgi:catechol 2,3-dioxygenase-like lactoylglutathione lyase family enzyme